MIKDAGFAAHYTAQLFLCKARSGEKEVLVWTYSTPSPFLSFPLLSPPLPIPPNQLGCLGEHCKLSQRGPQMHVCDILSPENASVSFCHYNKNRCGSHRKEVAVCFHAGQTYDTSLYCPTSSTVSTCACVW